MAKAGVVTEIIGKEAFEQVDQIEKRLDELVKQIEKVNASASAVKGAGTASQTATAQKQANAEAQKAIDLTAKLTEEELKQARAKVEKQMRSKQASDAVKEEINANAQVVGAYKAMNTELEKLRKQYKDMAAAGKANTTEAKALKEQVNKLDNEIKKLDSSVGQHQRNVGNYSSALDGLGGKFAAMPGPIGQVGAAMQNVGAIMLANPIVLIITAITAALAALVSAFKSTDEGADELAARWEQLTAIADVIIDRVGRLASGLFNIVKGNFSEGFDQVTESFSGISEQLGNAADAAYQYAYAMDAINERVTAFISQEAQLRNEIAKLMFASKDQTKSEDERKKALEQALEKEKELSTFKVDIAKQTFDEEVKYTAAKQGINEALLRQIIGMDYKELESAKKTNKAIADAWNRMGDGRAEQLEKLYADAINADTDYYEGSKRAFAQMTGFEQQQAQERANINAKLNKEKKKQDEQAAKERRSALNGEVLDALRLVRSIGGGAKLRMQSGIAQTVDTGVTPREIPQTPTAIEVPGVTSAGGLTEGEKFMAGLENEISAEASAWNEKIQIAQNALNQINSIIDQAYAARFAKIDEEAARDEAARERELAAAKGNDEKIRLINANYDKKEKEREKEKRRLQREQAQYQKTSSIIGAIINTALGITAALAHPGGVLGIVIAALAAATGLAQIALISSQPLPSYAKGRRGGKAEFAQINERGQEAVVTRSGEVYFPGGNYAYLPEGSSVIPHHDLVDMAGRASTVYGVNSTRRWDEPSDGMAAGFSMLAREIRNKKEAHVTVDKNGIRVMQRQGQNHIEWVNNRVRL